jgi:hypothetical protein
VPLRQSSEEEAATVKVLQLSPPKRPHLERAPVNFLQRGLCAEVYGVDEEVLTSRIQWLRGAGDLYHWQGADNALLFLQVRMAQLLQASLPVATLVYSSYFAKKGGLRVFFYSREAAAQRPHLSAGGALDEALHKCLSRSAEVCKSALPNANDTAVIAPTDFLLASFESHNKLEQLIRLATSDPAGGDTAPSSPSDSENEGGAEDAAAAAGAAPEALD